MERITCPLIAYTSVERRRDKENYLGRGVLRFLSNRFASASFLGANTLPFNLLRFSSTV